MAEYKRFSKLGAALLRKNVPVDVTSELIDECGMDFHATYDKLQADYYSMDNKMLAELKHSVTKAAQLLESDDVRKEIKRIKAVAKRLKANGRAISEDDLRDALLDVLPPSWSSWIAIVEREEAYDGGGLKSAAELETDILKRVLKLENKTTRNRNSTMINQMSTDQLDEEPETQEEWVALLHPELTNKLGVCAICFGPHPTAECWGTTVCTLCGGPHSSKLHEFIATAESGQMVQTLGDPNKTSQPNSGRGNAGGKGRGKGGFLSFLAYG